MQSLPPPEFVTIDPAATEADLVARYEAKSGKVLYPAQIERLFIDQIAYAHTLALSAIQNAGEQLLVRYSKGPILDYLGDLVGTPRLLATSARCRMQFTLPAIKSSDTRVPVGTRVTTSDGKVAFITDQDLTIPAGQLQSSVAATCETAGSGGNGWAVGQIATLPMDQSDGLTARNETVPTGGADEESDDRYKERIVLAPESYTNAGSRGAYRYHALTAHQSIVDVAVHGPAEGEEPGHVALYLLTADGPPSAELLELVELHVSGEKRRPLTDTVRVLPRVEVPYGIRAHLTFLSTADRAASMQLAQAAATAYVANLKEGLGRDIVPEQLTAVLQVAGVYRARVELPLLQVVRTNEWANGTSIELFDAGVSDG